MRRHHLFGIFFKNSLLIIVMQQAKLVMHPEKFMDKDLRGYQFVMLYCQKVICKFQSVILQ